MARRGLVVVSVILGLVASIAHAGHIPPSASIGSVKKVIVYAYGTPVNEPRGPLFVKTPVFTDELVETVENGGLHLVFADESDFHMGSNSIVRLDRFIYDPATNAGEMTLDLAKGVFRFITGRMKKRGIKLQTRAATLTIRGTDFQVDVAPSGRTTATVFQGLVFAQPRGGGSGVEVGRGQTVIVDGPDSDAIVTAAITDPSIGLAEVTPRSRPEFLNPRLNVPDVTLTGRSGAPPAPTQAPGGAPPPNIMAAPAPQDQPPPNPNAGKGVTFGIYNYNVLRRRPGDIKPPH